MDPVGAVLAEHPGVAEAAVVRTGTQTVVAVVPHTHCTAIDIRDHVLDALPAGQLPDLLVVLDSLPRDATGRVLADQLATQALANPSACGFTPPRTPAEMDLAAVWREVLGRRHVAIQDKFFDLGGDSITATLLLDLTSQRFGVEMSFDELLERPSLREVAAAIDDARVWDEVKVDG